jgi:hypothetical protein
MSRVRPTIAPVGRLSRKERAVEEGPEPQEWVEKAAEEHHHGAHGHGEGESRAEILGSAITAAVLAVCAAIGSLLSGHAANEAILAQTKATDQWSYYQSKGTKAHIYEVGAELVSTLASSPEAARSTRSTFEAAARKHEREKEEIQREAQALEAETQSKLRTHQRLALGVALFQVGIVLSSVSILVKFRPLFYLSLASGFAGLAAAVYGFVR